MKHHLACSALALGAHYLLSPTLSHAQTPEANHTETVASGKLEDIVVTAQRRAERLQDVPISVTALTADALASSGVSGSNALPQIAPSVNLGRSGPSGLFFIRGVGTTNAAGGEEGANAFYIDGVYLPDLSQTINNFNNVERIEVLKGPQGTLFGRNATGGLIHIITRDPSEEFQVQGQVGYANYDTKSGQLYVGGPLSDTLAADIALTGSHQANGWGRNLTRNTENQLGWHWGARSKLVWNSASGAAKITFAGDYNKLEDNTAIGWRLGDGIPDLMGNRQPSGHDTTANDKSQSRITNWGISLTGEFDFDWATLTSLSALRDTENNSPFDTDAGPLSLLFLDYTSGTRSYQQELRLASAGGGAFSWQTGMFFLRTINTMDMAQRGLLFGAANLGSDIDDKMTTNSYAAFAELSYSLTPTTHLTGGLRYTEDRRKFEATVSPVGLPLPVTTVNDRLNYGEFTYRFSLRQDLTQDINIYASLNRGFKAGAWSLQNPTSPSVRPQYITAYEVGLKSELFDRRLRLNLAAYHYDIDDYQVRSAAGSTIPATTLLNAGKVKVDGLDAEFEAVPTERLRVFGGFTLLKSKYSEFPFAPWVYPNPATCNNPGSADPGQTTGLATGGLRTCIGDAKGNRTPLAPKFSASIGSSYTAPVGHTGEIQFSVLYSYNSGYSFEPDNFLRQPEYDLINASIEYRPTEKLALEIWGRNLGNTVHYAQKLSQATSVVASQAAPRTYGVNLKFEF